MKVRPSPSLDAILSSRARVSPNFVEPAPSNFSEQKVDLVLRIKGFNTVQDDGVNFLVGEYEPMPKSNDQYGENVSTVVAC